jgi:hypothetical protein
VVLPALQPSCARPFLCLLTRFGFPFQIEILG